MTRKRLPTHVFEKVEGVLPDHFYPRWIEVESNPLLRSQEENESTEEYLYDGLEEAALDMKMIIDYRRRRFVAGIPPPWPEGDLIHKLIRIYETHKDDSSYLVKYHELIQELDTYFNDTNEA